ncbi:MAG: hypothetical protein RIS29_1798 [Bacteroidota bacterium]|jgi:proton glutamate symport protein
MIKLKHLTLALLTCFLFLAATELTSHYLTVLPSFISQLVRWTTLAVFLALAIKKRTLSIWILFSMYAGILIGITSPEIAQNLQVLSKIFLRLIKTIIAPILLSTLVVGIAGHSNLKQVGRMGWKSILYFEILTTIALALGLIMINITQAGVGVHLPAGFHEELPKAAPQTWKDILIHIAPENIAKSIYEGEVLQIVMFSILFGIALALLPAERKAPLLNVMESLAETMFKFTNIIMYFAPLGVGGAIAFTVGHLGVGILVNLFQLLATLYISLIIFILLVLIPIGLYFKIPIRQFFKAIYEPASIAFATTSSESALPLLMENLERFGVPRKMVSFILPMGYSFNLDGTTLYLSLASVFVAQAAGIDLSVSEQIIIGLTLMLTSKGVAGVPRASLVILLGIVSSHNLPVWPVLAILGIDELMDMARTTTNVIGNAMATCVIARSEKEFDNEKALNYSNEN